MLPLLFLVAAAPARPGPLMAVLEFRSKLKGELQQEVDPGYLTDVVRSAALKQVPGLRVMTRENMLVLLEGSGKTLADCEGACEVDTGRMLGADLVITGEVLRFGSSFKLNLRLHETRDGRLLSGSQASGRTIDELDQSLHGAVADLLAPVRDMPAPQPAPAPAPAMKPPPPVMEKPRPAPAPMAKVEPPSAPAIAASLEPEPEAAPSRGAFGVFIGGVVDAAGPAAGSQVSLVFGRGEPWKFLIGAAISPHPGARASIAARVAYGNAWDLALEPRLLVAPFPGGGVQGGGLGLRLGIHAGSHLDVVGDVAGEGYHTPTGATFAPLLTVGLEPHL